MVTLALATNFDHLWHTGENFKNFRNDVGYVGSAPERLFVTTYGTSVRRKRVNPFSATRRDSRHQNKVKVKGLGWNSSYLAGFSIFFFLSWCFEKVQSAG